MSPKISRLPGLVPDLVIFRYRQPIIIAAILPMLFYILCAHLDVNNKHIEKERNYYQHKHKHALSVALTNWASCAKRCLAVSSKRAIYVSCILPQLAWRILAQADSSLLWPGLMLPLPLQNTYSQRVVTASFADCKTSTTGTHWDTSFALQQE